MTVPGLEPWLDVSVIIPCRNMASYVGQAIQSVLSQTRQAREIIVVDDNSTDDTARVLRGFGPPVRVLRGPGAGPSISRNMALLTAVGEYVAFLDADDLWYPRKLEIQIAQMQAEGANLSFTDFHHSENPAQPGPPALLEYSQVTGGQAFSNLLRENFVATSTAIVRREALAGTSLFKAHMRVGEDLDLWLRLAKSAPLSWVKEPLAFKRRHPENITSSSEYPYSYVRSREEIAWQNRDASPADLECMRHQLAQAAYNAGRHAIRQIRPQSARGYFRKALRTGFSWSECLPWFAVSCLPTPFIRVLLETKHKVTQPSVR